MPVLVPLNIYKKISTISTVIQGKILYKYPKITPTKWTLNFNSPLRAAHVHISSIYNVQLCNSILDGYIGVINVNFGFCTCFYLYIVIFVSIACQPKFQAWDGIEMMDCQDKEGFMMWSWFNATTPPRKTLTHDLEKT